MDTDPVLQHHPVHGARLADINRRVKALVVGGGTSDHDQVRALAALGGVWRPVRELPSSILAAHHDEIVKAALAG